MATPSGRSDTRLKSYAQRAADISVFETLFEQPYRFSFFQAVRLLEHTQEESNKEAVRFRTPLSLDFPPSEINDLKSADANDQRNLPNPPEMTVSFMGLTGPLGVLPTHYTEMLIKRQQLFKDNSAHAFLDLFNHRLISLFYRAWKKYHFYVSYEQGERRALLQRLLSFVGMGSNALQGRLRVEDKGIANETLVYYSGLMAQRPHSASALRAILSDYFFVAVSIKQFVGQWLEITPAYQTALTTRNTNNMLGQSAMLGSRAWDHQAKLRVGFGPLTKHQFDDFLPTGRAFFAANQLIRFLLGVSVQYEILLILHRDEIPRLRIAASRSIATPLGWASWLKVHPFTRHAEDVLLRAAS